MKHWDVITMPGSKGKAEPYLQNINYDHSVTMSLQGFGIMADALDNHYFFYLNRDDQTTHDNEPFLNALQYRPPSSFYHQSVLWQRPGNKRPCGVGLLTFRRNMLRHITKSSMRTRRFSFSLWFLFLWVDYATGSCTPRSRYWKHIQESQSGIVSDLYNEDNDSRTDYFKHIRTCLDDSLSEESILRLSQNNTATPTAHVVGDLKDSSNTSTVLLVEIGSALAPHERDAIKALAACARQNLSNIVFEHRDFEESEGGNDCTFLNTLLQIFLPRVAATVQHVAELAYRHARWDRVPVRYDTSDESMKLHTTKHQNQYYPPPGTCGLRTSEYLSYRDFKNLGEHCDSGSYFTVLFSLSDPRSYCGGEYYIVDDEEVKYFFKPRQHSAIVFLSETPHGVTDIVSGHREMFTNELWPFDDPPWGRFRPDQGTMDLFVKRVDEEVQRMSNGQVSNDDGTGDSLSQVVTQGLQYFWPSWEERDEHLAREKTDKVQNGYSGRRSRETRQERDGDEEEWDEDEVDAGVLCGEEL